MEDNAKILLAGLATLMKGAQEDPKRARSPKHDVVQGGHVP